ncbi:TPA: hypothetical protein N0F65_000442 [Lagenidium giganteum]|uniref:Mitochondrial carrier protein n=1 Tax=Lagenidium giganteum TaxID=4803 RepID=A0AAV2YC89_9STRA|nr:TPA: hypothetical protein N0F65_000442 [Lagenidium giganteum]
MAQFQCNSAAPVDGAARLPLVVSSSRPRAGRASDSSKNGAQSIVAGVVAGCVTRSCTSPLDVLKIIIQVNGTVSNATSQFLTRASASSMSRFVPSSAATTAATSSGCSSVVKQTIKELYTAEGVRGFWKGNVAGCCRLGPYAGAKFFLFDSLQAHFLDENPSNLQRASCGAVAGLVATMVTYPMEVVRTRMITQNARNTLPQHQIRGVLHGIRLILAHEGVRGLYKGGFSGIVGAIPFEGVQFGCYEYLKFTSQKNAWPAYRWPEGKTELDGVDYFVCGSIAGAIAQTVAYPFDTVKKRLQTQSLVSSKAGKHMARQHYEGMCDCFQKVIRDEGLLALYRSTVPNLARIVPYAAVMFSTYEMTKKCLRVLSESAAP